MLRVFAKRAHNPCKLGSYKNLVILDQSRTAVLNSVLADVCSIRTQVPCEVDITGYSAMIPVRSDRIYSIQSALKCARRESKLYIFTEVYDVTLVRA